MTTQSIRDLLMSVMGDFDSAPDDGSWYSNTLHQDDVDAVRNIDWDSPLVKDDLDFKRLSALKDLIVDLPSIPNDGSWYYGTFDSDDVDLCRSLI